MRKLIAVFALLGGLTSVAFADEAAEDAPPAVDDAATESSDDAPEAPDCTALEGEAKTACEEANAAAEAPPVEEEAAKSKGKGLTKSNNNRMTSFEDADE